MRKRILLLFLTYAVLFLSGNVFYTFAAGEEFLRARSGSLAAQEAMLNAKEAAAVEYFLAPGDEMEIFVWQDLDITEAPPEESSALKKEYRISPGNIIEVFVWHNPDLSKDIIVGPDGEISVPLAGRINVVGLTAAQIEEKITDVLSEYVKTPQVSVMVKQFNTNKFSGGTNKIVDQLNSMKDYIVGPDGQISYPFVGRIQAAGLSIGQFEKKITEGLSKYMESPKLSIAMKKFSGDKIIVLGEVGYPGIYTYRGTINLIEVIALAGDFNQKAHADSVIVVHGNLSEKPEVRRINMSRVISRGTSKTDIVLYPNDVVFVPKTFVANFNQFLTDIAPLINSANSALQIRNAVRQLQGHQR